MSSLRKKKLSVRNPTSFNKSASKKKTDLSKREDTVFRKACQLATLCEIDVCIIYYGHNGELKVWPEESKVRIMADAYLKLNEKERMKKSTNLFVISKKKLLENPRLWENVTEMEDALKSKIPIFESEFLGVVDNLQNEPYQNLELVSFSTNLSNLSHTTKWDLSWGVSSTGPDVSMPSFSQDESEFPVILYNHDNATFYQVPNSVSRFDPIPLPSINDMSLAQQFGSNNYIDDLTWNNLSTREQFGSNNYIDLLPPLLDPFASWYHQTTTDPLMFSYS